MRNEPVETILKRFETPDEIRNLMRGRFEIVRIGGNASGFTGAPVQAHKDMSSLHL